MITATNCTEAWHKINHESLDVVLLDLESEPGRTLEYLSELMINKRDVKVVIIADSPCYRWDFRTWAADALLIKTSDMSGLVTTINEILICLRNRTE